MGAWNWFMRYTDPIGIIPSKGEKHGWLQTGSLWGEKIKDKSTPSLSAEQTIQDSVAQAQIDSDNKRRTLLSTGGETDLTQGTAKLGAGQTEAHTLLGG